jgi:hypothetical protein
VYKWIFLIPHLSCYLKQLGAQGIKKFALFYGVKISSSYKTDPVKEHTTPDDLSSGMLRRVDQ